MYLKLIFPLCLIILVASCTLPKQPLLTLKEKKILDDLEFKCQCKVERNYTSSYLRYSKKGDYLLSFKGGLQQSLYTYITDSGFVIAKHIYNEILKTDTNITFIRYQIIDSIGVNTFKNTYYEYKIDTLSASLR